MAKNNVQVSEHLLNNILRDMQLDHGEEPSDRTIVVYKHLKDIIAIYQHCPAVMPSQQNNSHNFLASLERLPILKTAEEYGRVDVLLQHVSNRIVEKYRGFTEAFRRFDKNFDGSLNFREFVSGMDEMGIHLTLPDYRLIFDCIDFNQNESIDYFKFCLLDYKQEAMRAQLARKHQQQERQQKHELFQKTADGNARFRDGNLPKNKEPHKFVDDCQTHLLTQTYLKKKRLIRSTSDGLKCAKDLPNSHVFGVSATPTHSFTKIMQNHY